ncbi:MAG: YitT family protein [Candidatus Dojkabacteria bacterium]|jgi:uncharacterized membrane-anchored protein YitT (DUF2179 family)|nr:YitT family protein [Candidatus Dojkabacteria bacterium]
MKISKKEKLKKEIRLFVYSTIGIIILGLSINFISWKYKLVSGGLPGYGLAFNYIIGFPLGYFLLLVNTLILILQYFVAGKVTGLRGIYGYIFLSVFIEITRRFFGIQQAEAGIPNEYYYMAIQGFIGGTSIALVIAHGYSFGSYSSIYPIVKKFVKISAPAMFFLFDAILVIITILAFDARKGYLLFVNAVFFYLSFRLFLKYFREEVDNGHSIFYFKKIKSK